MTEILAPAGDEKSAYAAIDAGADAVYLGLSSFSARSSAENFGWEQLEKLIAHAHFFGVKIYVAMNTLVKDGELSDFVDSAVRVHNTGADAIIIQDIYLGAYLKKTYPQMCLHLSTQAGICNAYGAAYAKELGFSRVILARETTMEDIAKIAKIIETEVFVQGALCTCFSGQCYLSSFAGGNSGNRGRCKQPCRKRYSIDRQGYDSLAYRISLADLSVGEDIDGLIKAGVSSFKIEGRMRRPEYVSAAVQYYKKILSCGADLSDLSALKRTYNRGNYTKVLAFGQDKTFISSAVQGHIGEFVGNVFVESGRYVCHSSADFASGDGFKILREGKEVGGGVYGERVKGGFTIKSSARLKNGDKAFITTDVRLNKALLDKKRVRRISLSASFKAGEKPSVTIGGRTYAADFTADKAVGRPLTGQDIIKCFNKVDIYPFEVDYKSLLVGEDTFVPASFLNAFRREAYASYYVECTKNPNSPIEEVQPLPVPSMPCKNSKTAVVATDLSGVAADIGILKPTAYAGDLSPLYRGFKGEKFLYLPPFLTGSEIERVKPLIAQFDGIYSGGNYAVVLAKELNKKLFAGLGFNIFNSLSLQACPADYIALSKELTVKEAQPLARANTFYLTKGDIKVMDLIYCPFSKSCAKCDKREEYTLTDENGRAFPLHRYTVAKDCRFELFNCATLQTDNNFTGVLVDRTLSGTVRKYTKGHSENPVL